MRSQRNVNYRLGGGEWVPWFIKTLDQSLCTQCCTCVGVCPAQVFKRTIKGTVEPTNRNNCIGCTVCARQCPAGAIVCAALPSETQPL